MCYPTQDRPNTLTLPYQRSVPLLSTTSAWRTQSSNFWLSKTSYREHLPQEIWFDFFIGFSAFLPLHLFAKMVRNPSELRLCLTGTTCGYRPWMHLLEDRGLGSGTGFSYSLIPRLRTCTSLAGSQYCSCIQRQSRCEHSIPPSRNTPRRNIWLDPNTLVRSHLSNIHWYHPIFKCLICFSISSLFPL